MFRLLSVALAGCAVLAAPAAASTISVTVFNDPAVASCPGASCSLRAAVGSAAASDTVSLPAGTYTITRGMPITNAAAFTLSGAGAATTTIDAAGNGANPAFSLTGTVSVNNVTIENAQSSAIAENGNLTLNNDVFHDNTGPSGGGAVNEVFGQVTVKASTFYANVAGTAGSGANGGALFNQSGNSVLGFTITDSTFNNNHAIGPGARGGAIDEVSGNITLTNSTVAGNSAVAGGGGIQQEAGTINSHATLVNSIVASNTSNAGGANCDRTGSGDFLITSSNIVFGGTTGCTANSGPANTPLTSDPKLGVLQDNGGPTPTMAIGATSPAKDAGVAGGTATDQRGVARPQGSAKDIGAYELVQSGDVSLTMAGSGSVTEGANITYTITIGATAIANDGDRPTVTDVLPANVSYVSATPTQGQCSGNATVTCTVGLLANGQTASITLVVKSTTGNVSNTASVTASRPDSNSANNSATSPTTVTAAPPGTGSGGTGGTTPTDGAGGGTPTGGGTPSGDGPAPGSTPTGNCALAPRLTGLTLKKARKRLKARGCTGKVRVKGHARKGHAPRVRKQRPAAGKPLAAGRPILLYVR